MAPRTLRRDLRHLDLEHLEQRALLSVTPLDLDSLPPALGSGFRDDIPTELSGRVTAGYWSAVDQQTILTVPAIHNSLARVDSAGTIQTYIHVAHWSELLVEQLTSHGVTVDHALQDLGLIQAWVPLESVEAIASLSWVERLDLPAYAVTNVTSAGDGIVNADDVRSQFAAEGIDGSGVKVGVISDGAVNRAASQSAGELPSITIQRAGYGDEGTAMLEIVHDLAPGAALYFSGYTAPFTLTSADMASTIGWMVTQGVDVIVDDLAFYGESYFQDGIVATAASNAIANGVTYITSAGNAAEEHYQAPYSQGASFGDGYWHNFAGSDVTQSIILAGNSTLSVYLQWSDAWGASANDYDLYLFDASGNYITSSNQIQNGSQNPFESFEVTNNSSSPVELQVLINKVNGQERELELFTFGTALQQYTVAGDSIIGQAAVVGVITVGAVSAADPGNDTIESFSSQGPSTVITNFSSQTKDHRPSLDGVSIDGVQTKTGQLGHFGQNPFYGTSAAAPHVAGIAALLLDAVPSLTSTQITELLGTTAVDLYGSGYENTSGAGRFDALAAVRKAAYPWHNFNDPADTTNDGNINSSDVLVVFNYILTYGMGAVPVPTTYVAAPGDAPPPISDYLDTTRDGRINSRDALLVINRILAEAAETESNAVTLEAIDLAGNPITSIAVGQQFRVRARVDDTSATPNGTYAAYHNLQFDGGKAALDGSVDFASGTNIAIEDELQSGVLNLGAILEDELGGGEQLLYTATFTATMAGTLSFTTAANSSPDQANLNYGTDDPISGANISFGGLNLNILKVPLNYAAVAGVALKVRKSGADYEIVDVTNPGSPVVVASQLAANTSAINITGSAAHDTILIEASALVDTVPINIDGGAQNDTININDLASTANTTYTLTSNGVSVGAKSISIANAEGMNLDLTSGIATVNVQSTFAFTTIAAGAAGQTINLGASTQQLGQLSNEILIAGNQSILNIDDSANTTDTTYSLTSTAFVPSTGANFYSYSSIAELNILLGSGNNFVTTQGSGANYTSILGGVGNDDFTVGSTNTLAPTQFKSIFVDGAGGYNGWAINDKSSVGNHTYTFGTNASPGRGTLVRDSESTVFEWKNAEVFFRGGAGNDNLIVNNAATDLYFGGGDGDDTIEILATEAGTRVTAADLHGTNHYRVGNATTDLSAIDGEVWIDANSVVGWTADLVVDDSAATGGHAYTFTNADGYDIMTRGDITGLIAWRLLLTADIKSGAGANTILADLEIGAKTTTILGNTSADAIQVTGSNWDLIVAAGNGNDTVTLGSGTSAAGINGATLLIDGGAGSDEIIMNDSSRPGTLYDLVTDAEEDNGMLFSDGGEGSTLLGEYASVETRTLIG